MPTYTFQSYPATVQARFACLSCGKPNRVRTFRHECTVNPFNKSEDGSIRTPKEVMRQSMERANAEREQFLRKPLCRNCEDGLSYTERRQLRAERAGQSELEAS